VSDPRVELLAKRARVEPEHARQLYFQHTDFREVQFDALAMMKALHVAFAPGRSLRPVDGSWVDEDDNGISIDEREFLHQPISLADTHYTLLLDGITVSTMLSDHRVLTNIGVLIAAGGDTADVVMNLVLEHTERAGLVMVVREDR
jgi:hypothetical protein